MNNNNLNTNEYNTNSLKNINRQNIEFGVNVIPSLDGLKNIGNTDIDRPFLNSQMNQNGNNNLSEYNSRLSVNQIQNQINDLSPYVFRANNVSNIINNNNKNNVKNVNDEDKKNNLLNDTINAGIKYLNNAINNAKNKIVKPKEKPIMKIKIKQQINGVDINELDNELDNFENKQSKSNTNEEKEENNIRRSINDMFVKSRISKLFMVLVLIIAGFLIYHFIIKKKKITGKKSVRGKKNNSLATKVAMNNNKGKLNNLKGNKLKGNKLNLNKLKTGKGNNIILETI